MVFTNAQKIFIAKSIKEEVQKLFEQWEVPIKLRERAIMAAVADAIVNLPSQEE